MPKTKNVTVRLDADLKQEAEQVFSDLGLSTSQAIVLFYKQVQLNRGLPFEVRLPNLETRQALADADNRHNLKSYDNVDELFEDLGV